ncbi:MAG TPA: hypothetical protein PK177_18760, partial [Burkholderiaceae bacterium]|nr:hypothetical protein [Burkholderiaceae bacterium]
MNLDGASSQARRRFLGAGMIAGSLLVGPRSALASVSEVSDDAGRRVGLPASPRRVFPAGAPASVFVYCLAPDRLILPHPRLQDRGFV